MNHSIAYDNLLTGATLVVSSEATGFEGANAATWTTYDWWKPAATGTSYITATLPAALKADYFAVFAHDIDTTGSTIRLEYSIDGGTNWIPCTPYLSTPDVIYHRMAQVVASKWRVKLSCPTAVASVAVISFGEIMDIPLGVPESMITPDRAFGNEYMSNIGDNGRLLGNTLLRNAASITIEALLQDPTWITTYWIPFIAHAETKAFFYVWDDTNAAFCWTDGNIPDIEYIGSIWNNAKINVKAQTWLS